MVVSTHLKNTSQIGSSPPSRVENKKCLKPPVFANHLETNAYKFWLWNLETQKSQLWPSNPLECVAALWCVLHVGRPPRLSAKPLPFSVEETWQLHIQSQRATVNSKWWQYAHLHAEYISIFRGRERERKTLCMSNLYLMRIYLPQMSSLFRVAVPETTETENNNDFQQGQMKLFHQLLKCKNGMRTSIWYWCSYITCKRFCQIGKHAKLPKHCMYINVCGWCGDIMWYSPLILCKH